MKKVRWPDNPEKIYGYIGYHEWFYEWDNIEEAFKDIIELYMTEYLWDYDGFAIFKGNPKWELGVDNPINWKEILSKEQLDELKKAEEYNDNMEVEAID